MKIKLEHPIQFEGRTLDEIELRRLKAGEMARANKAGGDEIEIGMRAIATSAGLPLSAIEELDAADMTFISDEMDKAGFFRRLTRST